MNRNNDRQQYTGQLGGHIAANFRRHHPGYTRYPDQQNYRKDEPLSEAASDILRSRVNLIESLFSNTPTKDSANRFFDTLTRDPSDAEAKNVKNLLSQHGYDVPSEDETLVQANQRMRNEQRQLDSGSYLPTAMSRKRQLAGDEASIAENQEPLISKLLSQLTPEDLEKLTRMQGAKAESTFREQPQEVISTDEPIDSYLTGDYAPVDVPAGSIESQPINLSQSPQYREFAEREAETRRQRQKRLQGGF